MATDIIRNFLIQAPNPTYFPMIFECSPGHENEYNKTEGKPEEREDEEEREEEEEDEECEAQEDEEECLDEFHLSPAHNSLDMTKQLLRFADIISRDVQKYFGRCSDNHEACDIYSDSVSLTTSGRLRYYDDLLRIARARSPEEQESSLLTCADDQGVRVTSGNSSLGPLAELFDHRGLSQGRGQPMIKRHLPRSFWTEPMTCCSLISFSNTADITHTNRGTPTQDSMHPSSNRHMHSNPLTHHITHTIDSAQLDFSDLLADWDPHLEFNPTVTEDTHMQH